MTVGLWDSVTGFFEDLGDFFSGKDFFECAGYAWNDMMQLASDVLTKNPAKGTYKDVWESISTIYTTLNVVAVSLLCVFFLYGFCRDSCDLHTDLTFDKTIKMFIRLIITSNVLSMALTYMPKFFSWGKSLTQAILGENGLYMVYDFDGDGKAELVCKTAPGTMDGKGKKIFLGTDDPEKDWRNLEMNHKTCGYILEGPEYLTIFSGETGEELHTIPYEVERGEVSSWGDSYGNRVDRFLACVAYLDGVHPSVVMCRGYYAKTTLVAYDFMNGKLVKRWKHISDVKGEGAYGQGNHNLSVADVDGDGCDEIIYGSCAINNDGTLLYRTGLGHGDAMHVANLDPDRPGYQVWEVHEEKEAWQTYGYEMHDARTGEILWGGPTKGDNGRGLAADIDPNHRGFEMWSSGAPGIYNCKGEKISDNKPGISFRVYWDGDLQDEILNGTNLSKWNGNKAVTIHTFPGAMHCNGTKRTPNVSADLFGDWREEVVFYDANDPSKLRIYTTTIPTEHRLYTLMHDPMYRLGIAWQNTGYNQPPHLGFYIGDGLKNIPWPEMYTPRSDLFDQ